MNEQHFELEVEASNDGPIFRLTRNFPMWQEDTIRRVSDPGRDSSRPMVALTGAQGRPLAANLLHRATPELQADLEDKWGYCSNAAFGAARRALDDTHSPLLRAILQGTEISERTREPALVSVSVAELGEWMRQQPEYRDAPKRGASPGSTSPRPRP